MLPRISLTLCKRVVGLTRYEPGEQVDAVLHRQDKTERMRAAEVSSERILGGEFATHAGLAISLVGSDRDRAVMTTEAQAAGDAERRLRVTGLVIGGAVVGVIGRFGILLVPQRTDSTESTMRRMTEGATGDARSLINRSPAAGREIMHAQGVDVGLLSYHQSPNQQRK